MKKHAGFLFAALLVMSSLVGLPHWTDGRAHADEPLVIFAAASLTNAISELALRFEEQSGHQVIVSLAATSVLARQIKDGAPAHVFISANTAWMDDVIDAGAVIAESRAIIAGNRLVLAGARDISLPPVDGMTVTADYPLSGVAPGLPFAIGNPDHVPAGIYARQALQNLGLWDDIKGRLIPMPDVRAVIANIDRGEVAGGFVYASDMELSTNARIIGMFPAASHAPVHYVAGIIEGRHTTMADRFLAFLLSSESESVFINFGFLPPPSPSATPTEPE